MNKIKWLAIFLSLFLSFPALSKANQPIGNALRSSVMVVIKDYASGSGFAVAQENGKTLIMTNDHVCQASRGKDMLTDKDDYSSPLNTIEITIEDIYGKQYKAKVVKASNLHLLKKKEKGSDLCLLEVDTKLQVVTFSGSEPLLGDRVFSVSAPKGIFPLVNEGFVGAAYEDRGLKEIRVTSIILSPGSSGGGVFDSETGEVVGVVFAIVPLLQDVPAAVATITVPVGQARQFLQDYQNRKAN